MGDGAEPAERELLSRHRPVGAHRAGAGARPPAEPEPAWLRGSRRPLPCRDVRSAAASAAELEEVAPGRPNVYASLGPADEPGLLFLVHTDTVPAGRRLDAARRSAASSPTGASSAAGAADMKAGIAAAVIAMAALQRSGIALTRPVALAAVIDEEETGAGRARAARAPGLRRARRDRARAHRAADGHRVPRQLLRRRRDQRALRARRVAAGGPQRHLRRRARRRGDPAAARRAREPAPSPARRRRAGASA